MKNNDYIKYTPNLCCIIKNKKIEEEEYQLFNNYNSKNLYINKLIKVVNYNNY